jgi:hypothetical protein
VLLVCVALYGVTSLSALRSRLAWLSAHRRAVLVGTMVAALLVLPQLAFYRYAMGGWLASPYGPDRGFDFTSPKIIEVLVGTRKGLFFWSPILVFSVLGLFVMRRVVPQLFLPSIIVLPVQVYLVASWYDWQFGASYGHRGFTDLLSIFALAMAAFYDRILRTWLAVPVGVATSLAVALSLAQMLQYWLRIIPLSDTTWDVYKSIFLTFSR